MLRRTGRVVGHLVNNIRRWIKMGYVFADNSSIAGSYVILILAGLRTYEQVPNLYNLREVVAFQLGIDPAGEVEEEEEIDNGDGTI